MLGFSIRNASGERLGGTDPRTIRTLANRLEADLVAVVKVNAEEADRLGRMIKGKAELEVTVYRGDGLASVASKTFRTTGDRSADPDKALDSAVDAAVDEMTPYLSDRMIERVGKDLVVRRLAIDGLESDEDADRVEAFIRARPGVNRVDRVRWSGDDFGYLELEIAMQPTAVANVPIWLRQVPGVDLRLEESERGTMQGVAR